MWVIYMIFADERTKLNSSLDLTQMLLSVNFSTSLVSQIILHLTRNLLYILNVGHIGPFGTPNIIEAKEDKRPISVILNPISNVDSANPVGCVVITEYPVLTN